MTTVLDPDVPMEAVFIECVQIARKRRQKYTGDGDWDANFVSASDRVRADGLDLSPADIASVLIAVKEARTEVGDGKDHDDDSLRDVEIDRINYLALRLALRDTHDTGTASAQACDGRS